MRPGRVPLAKSLTTNIVGNIEEVQFVVRSRLLVNATHPSAAGKRVGMKVQHDRCPPRSRATRCGPIASRNLPAHRLRSATVLISPGNNRESQKSPLTITAPFRSARFAARVDFPEATLPHNMCSVAVVLDMTMTFMRGATRPQFTTRRPGLTHQAGWLIRPLRGAAVALRRAKVMFLYTTTCASGIAARAHSPLSTQLGHLDRRRR